MKSAGWYFMKGGQKVWAATVKEIRKLAQLAADELGKPVTVRRSRPAAKRKAAPMTRNPMSLGGAGGSPAMWAAEERARRARLDYLAATKARRLAKGLRSTGKTASAEAGRRKTGKFQVTASNRKERFTIFRPSLAQAKKVARDFEAAGYSVAVQEV